VSLAHSQHLVISPNISHKLERLVGVDNEVVGVLVGGVGDGGSKEPVAEEGESVMDEVNNNGGEVIPGGLLGGLSLVVVIDIRSLDIIEANQFVGGLLESNTSTPGTDGGNKTGEHVVEGISVGSGGSEGLVHLPGDGERSPDDVGGETDVHEYPQHFDDTEGISGP